MVRRCLVLAGVLQAFVVSSWPLLCPSKQCTKRGTHFIAGPALVNLGRALVAGGNVAPFATYLAALLTGGLLV